MLPASVGWGADRVKCKVGTDRFCGLFLGRGRVALGRHQEIVQIGQGRKFLRIAALPVGLRQQGLLLPAFVPPTISMVIGLVAVAMTALVGGCRRGPGHMSKPRQTFSHLRTIDGKFTLYLPSG